MTAPLAASLLFILPSEQLTLGVNLSGWFWPRTADFSRTQGSPTPASLSNLTIAKGQPNSRAKGASPFSPRNGAATGMGRGYKWR